MATNNPYYYNNWINGRILENQGYFKDANGRIFQAHFFGENDLWPSAIFIQTVNQPVGKFSSKLMDPMELKRLFLNRYLVVVDEDKILNKSM